MKQTNWTLATIAFLSLGGCQGKIVLDTSAEDTGTLNDPSWTYETVTEIMAELEDLDFALDGEDRTHISLVDGNNLDYLTLSEDTWLRDPVDRAGGGGTGNPAAMQINAAGEVHHAYKKSGLVMLAKGEPGDWDPQILRSASSAEPYISLAITDDGDHVSYRYSAQAWHLSEADAWTPSSVDMGNANWSALAFDTEGTGHLFAIDHSAWSESQEDMEADKFNIRIGIRHALFQDGEWQTQPTIATTEGLFHVGDGDPRGRIPATAIDLVLDGEGLPHITYFYPADPTDPETPWVLMYAVQTDQGWSIETIDEDAGVGYYASLALGSSGLPHVSYYNQTEQQVFYATRSDSGWRTDPVEPDAITGPRSEIVVSSNDVVSVVYPSEGQLRLATTLDGD